MADSKISALPASTTPLAGTEVLPIVQSSATKQVSVANLTAGRAISATQLTLTTGNLIVASGQGIDFSATPGTGTSELFADYEEGTFTPGDDSGAGLTFTMDHAKYTKIGRLVTVSVYLTYPVTASALTAKISLPFISANYDVGSANSNSASGVTAVITIGGAGTCTIRNSVFTSLTNANMSGAQVLFTISYPV